MGLEEVKERFKSEWQQTKERLEDNSTFVSLRDRFQSYSPLVQKLILFGALGLVVLGILSLPMGHYETSSEHLAEFDSSRSLIKDLFRVQKDISETPQIPTPPPIDSVKSRIEFDLQGAQLLPEQIRGVTVLPAQKTPLYDTSQNEGSVEISLAQLNIRQITDLGNQFQSISPSVKLKDLVISASAADSRYFDVIYRLLVLKVLPEETIAPDPAEKPGKKGRR